MGPNYFLIAGLFLAALLIAGLVTTFLIVFNGLIALRNEVKKAWADIDVVLKQRYDELPNVIATVRGYAAHEQALFEKVAAARSGYLGATDVHGKLAAEGLLAGPLRTVFALAENYPDLKADQNFLELQKRVSSLETEIADRRELYNAAVNEYNTRLASLPDLAVAAMLNLQPLELFAASTAEQAGPDVPSLLNK